MFVSAINSFSSSLNQNKKASFKGAAEETLFAKLVEDIPKLQYGLKQYINETETHSLYSVLYSAYDSLQTLFKESFPYSFKVSDTPRGLSGFKFKDAKGRDIRISIQLARPGIFYREFKKGLLGFGNITESRGLSYELGNRHIKKTTTDMRDLGALKQCKQEYTDYLLPDGDRFISENDLKKHYTGRSSGSSC